MNPIGHARRRLFGIASAEAVFRRPGFAPEAWQRFAPVARALMDGYHASLEDPRPAALGRRLDEVDPALRGFAYEGAGMGLAALDVVSPGRSRLPALADGPGAPHAYPIYVGVGLALARLRRSPEAWLARLDPVLGWVTADGYGFHEAFFHRRRCVDRHTVPAHLTDYGRQLFDQGIGRALWFSGGGVTDRVAVTIGGYPTDRHADLWTGVGLACAYGGGTDRTGLSELLERSGSHRIRLARGAAIAAWGRHQAGHTAPHTELACEIFCGRTGSEAERLAEQARDNVPVISSEPAHRIWVRRIDDLIAHHSVRRPAAATGTAPATPTRAR